MKKILEKIWARLEINGKQLYDQQKLRTATINMYNGQATHYEQEDFMTLIKKYYYDSPNNSQN